MRLARFIRRHRDAIIADWAIFAGTMQPAASAMGRQALRDHAGELLDATTDDMDTPQSPEEQANKAKGFGSVRRMAVVAQRHAIRRMRAGFRLAQVLAEYRALRACVVSHWQRASPRSSAATREDLMRFHEAIDEALTEAVNRYSRQVEHHRDQFVAILGHDLRNPLGAIAMSATLLSRAAELNEKHAAIARRIVNASGRMNRMVSDLLDLTRTRLGEGIPITKAPTDLEALCREVIDELQATHPGRTLTLECRGALSGTWDGDRLAQIISNLVANALQHGDASKPVTIRVASRGSTAVLTVHNHGKAIPPASLKTIFDPMVRSSEDQDHPGQSGSLGLGLLIVREVVIAHRGMVRVTSTNERGTTFRVSLPRYDKNERRPPRAATSPCRIRPHLGSLSAAS